jgi:hypothetical protein
MEEPKKHFSCTNDMGRTLWHTSCRTGEKFVSQIGGQGSMFFFIIKLEKLSNIQFINAVEGNLQFAAFIFIKL